MNIDPKNTPKSAISNLTETKIKIKKITLIFDLKIYLATYLVIILGVLTFSEFVYRLFGHIIPEIVWNFFKEFGAGIALVIACIFVLTWFLNARPHGRPKCYSLVVFDVFGNETIIEGVRTDFKIFDVAWSFMKQYKTLYPLYNFALVSDISRASKKTIFRYV